MIYNVTTILLSCMKNTGYYYKGKKGEGVKHMMLLKQVNTRIKIKGGEGQTLDVIMYSKLSRNRCNSNSRIESHPNLQGVIQWYMYIYLEPDYDHLGP